MHGNSSLRIALLLDPLTLRAKGGDHAQGIARELLGLGHTVRAFGDTTGAIPRSGADPATEGHPTGDDGRDTMGLAAWKPDVIVVYGALSPTAWWGARTAKKLDRPLVLVETGFPSTRRWHENLLRSVGERLWGRPVRRATARVVALGPIAREQALRAGFREDQVVLLPGGVDLATFRPALSSGLIARHRIRGRILLYVGEIRAERGLEILLPAFAHTVGQRGDWNLVLAGEGPDRGRMRALADRLGVGSRVWWSGWPRPEELPGLMASSTFLAVPALDDAVRGTQIPRALACGLPVLASDRPRLAALVDHEVTGLLAPSGDLGAWTAMVRRAAASPIARRRWGENARRVSEETLAWPRVARVFETQLRAALAEHSPDPATQGEAGTETAKV